MPDIAHLRNKPLLELLDRIEREGPQLDNTLRYDEQANIKKAAHNQAVNELHILLTKLRKEITE